MTRDKDQAAVLSRIFSVGVVRELCNEARSPILARLLRHSGEGFFSDSKATLGEAYEHAFRILRRVELRDEYVYRAAITQKILLGRHSLDTATMLPEMRAGASKADVVVLNGTSNAYEIKSERDSLARLPGQLRDYCSVYASVTVVAAERHLPEVLKIAPIDVGVVMLSPRYTLRVVRPSQHIPERTSPVAILEALRVPEACMILDSLGLEVPAVPNTRIRGELRRVFAALDATSAHAAMVRILRHTRSQARMREFIKTIPSSLRASVLTIHPEERARGNLKKAVDTPLVEVLKWT